MKSKRLLCVVLVIFTVLMGGCIKKQPYKFLYDVSEINQISIVYMINADPVYTEYETKFEIENKDEFLEEFNKILFNMYLGDPTTIQNNSYAILVEYYIGDCEFINYRAQDRRINSEYYFGRVKCNEEDFNNFINSYLSLEE